MSSTHLRLEGPDLPSLLEQVRAEYGPGARIVHAERIRRGGIGGFFARERYHVEVEVGDVRAVTAGPAGRAPAGSPGRGASSARSVLDLVDRLNQEEDAAHRRYGAPRTPVQDLPVQGSVAPGQSGPGAPHQRAAVTGPSWAAAWPDPSLAPAQPAAGTAGSPALSTQSASFADVLSRLQHSVSDVAEGPTPTTLLTGLAARSADVADPTRLGDPTRLVGPSDAPGSGRVEEAATFVPLGSAPRAAADLADGGADRFPVRPGRPDERPAHLDEHAALVGRALRLGVPAHVLEGAADPPAVYRRLLSWVESRPSAPMMAPAPGQVIAVVGELSAAMRVARTVAFELGVDPTMIHLAVPATSTGHDVPVGRLLSEPGDIAARRHRWREASGSTIVVIEAALPPAARAWLTSVVSALAPTFTWAVAQASTKVADVVAWAELVGDVDAVALENVPATGDPASSLAGPLPIGLLDGRRASVSRWMAMLTMDGGRR